MLNTWMEKFPYDFANNEALQTSLREFVQKLASATATERKWGEILLSSLHEASRFVEPVYVSPRDNSSPPAQNSAAPPAKKRSKPRGILFKERMSPRKIQFLDLDTRVLAKQMCIYDHRQLCKIVPSELVNNNWGKGKGENVIAIRERNNLVREQHRFSPFELTLTMPFHHRLLSGLLRRLSPHQISSSVWLF